MKTTTLQQAIEKSNQKTGAGELFPAEATTAPQRAQEPTKYRTSKRKGSDGWRAETFAEVRGQDYQIDTYKTRPGLIQCIAMEVEVEKGATTGTRIVCFSPFSAKRWLLAEEQVGTATEKAIDRVHAKGLEAFEQFRKEKEAEQEPYRVEVGQVIYTDGTGDRRRRAVYEITGKNKFKTVMLDGSQLCSDERVRPIAEKFGIGTYYTEGDKISPEQVAQLVEAATKATEERNAAARKAREEQEEEKRAILAKGADIVSEVPKWAKAVIIASYHEDASDTNSDYFNHTTTRTVFIEFTASTRNDMEELRTAAAKFEGTAELATADKEHEHREMYSMGAGFYLGTYKHNTGWKVSKVPLTSYRATLEAMQLAAGRGDFLVNTSAPAPAEADTGAEGIRVQLNEKMRGVEIRFSGKPSDETLSAIRNAGGWRWSKFQKMWYAGDTERTRSFAYGLAGLPVPGKE